jgi:nucleoside diphosphate kinase
MELSEKKVVENKIIDILAQKGRGKIIVFKEENTPYLIAKIKREYKKNPLYLQVEENYFLKENDIFEKEVLSLEPKGNLYLLFVYFDKVSQEISEKIWIIPSLDFKELFPNNKFSASFKEKGDKCFPYLIKKDDLFEVVFKLIKDPFFRIKEFKEKGLDLGELKNFIIEARKKTSLSSLSSSSPVLGGKERTYQEKDFYYRNIYFSGERQFFGQEIVYQYQKPVFFMIYKGSKVREEVMNFLNEVLFELREKVRFGKNNFYESPKRKLKYQEEGRGEFESFEGKERILKDEKVVYELVYFGGLL